MNPMPENQPTEPLEPMNNNPSGKSRITTNPAGPTTGSFRVIRGGGFRDYADGARCAIRAYDYPLNAHDYLGFRSVLSPGQP